MSSFVQSKPIVWRVHRLICTCGGEFEHKLNVKYADKARLHACNKCGAMEQHEDVYPKTVWEETE